MNLQKRFYELSLTTLRVFLASRTFQFLKTLALLLLLLLFLTWLHEKQPLPPLVFQSIGTSIIVLTFTVLWDRMKAARHYHNLCMALAFELYYIYGDLIVAGEIDKDKPLSFKPDTWQQLKFPLAQYIPTFWYQKLFGLYVLLDELKGKTPKEATKTINQVRGLIEECYSFLVDSNQESILPTLQSSLKNTIRKKYNIYHEDQEP